ncbi:phospholipid/glycerol acyltransferase [Actinobacteria bacterium OK074]|nr:phospholipid/glycerol acyltransferase [Actinobacteria bacterium OK074]
MSARFGVLSLRTVTAFPRAVTRTVPRPVLVAPAAPSAWLPTAPCSPRTCVEASAPRTVVPRALLRFGTALIVLIPGILLCRLVGRLPAGPRERLVRGWCRAVVRALGVRVRITGCAPPEGGLLLVAHHVSWLDIPLLAAVRPARMLAKREVRGWPVAGAITTRARTLFIDRDRLRALPGTVAAISEALRAGSAVAAFPEGSTWCGRARGHFRRAVFQAALDAGVPVQPVRLNYRTALGAASTSPAFVGEDSLLTSVWRVVTARGLVAEVEVRPPLAPGRLPDRRALARAAQQEAEGAPRPTPDDLPGSRLPSHP